MKTLIILLLISFTLKSQTYTEKTFNIQIFNKKLYEKINHYRKKNNLDTLIYSKVSEKNISKVNVNKMIEKSTCYHPDVNFYGENKLVDLLFDEYYKILNFKKINRFLDDVRYAEISAYTTKKFNNYDEITDYFLNGWVNSPKHKEILNTSFKIGYSGITSCYIGKGNEGTYVSFNFLSMTTISEL